MCQSKNSVEKYLFSSTQTLTFQTASHIAVSNSAIPTDAVNVSFYTAKRIRFFAQCVPVGIVCAGICLSDGNCSNALLNEFLWIHQTFFNFTRQLPMGLPPLLPSFHFVNNLVSQDTGVTSPPLGAQLVRQTQPVCISNSKAATE